MTDKQSCITCKFWKDSGKCYPVHSVAWGDCSRYPVWTESKSNHFCGEWMKSHAEYEKSKLRLVEAMQDNPEPKL